jgi:hypothetical protein
MCIYDICIYIYIYIYIYTYTYVYMGIGSCQPLVLAVSLLAIWKGDCIPVPNRLAH